MIPPTTGCGMGDETDRMMERARRTYRKVAESYLDSHGRLLANLPPLRDGEPLPQHRHSDAWLLLAIMCVYRSEPPIERLDLEAIVGAGDAINHAIFTDAELRGGFVRLARAGHITIEGEYCMVTDAFHEQWNAAGIDQMPYLHVQRAALEKLLASVPD
jgi:hypothetical protein